MVICSRVRETAEEMWKWRKEEKGYGGGEAEEEEGGEGEGKRRVKGRKREGYRTTLCY